MNKNIENENRTCPVEVVALIIGKKWVPTIVFHLVGKTLRLGELQRSIEGCSKKILIEQLNTLIEYRIVSKNKITQNNTVESYYTLTKMGEEIVPILVSMKKFGCRYKDENSLN